MQPTTGQERTQKHFAPSLFAYSPKGKRKQQPTKKDKAKKKDNQRTTGAKREKDKQKDKSWSKKKKKGQKGRQTRRKSYNRLTIHAYKAPQATRRHQPIQIYTCTPKPAKNALKTPNRAIFKHNAPQAKQESDQNAGSTPQEEMTSPESLHTCTQWTRPPPQRESHNGSPCNPQK